MITLDAYKDKVVGVFGLGRAGMAAVRSLVAGGAKVVAWDDNEENRKTAEATGLDVRFHKVSKWPWDHLTLVVLSPGIPLTFPAPHEVVKQARIHCCPIVGDIELLYQAAPHATYVAITGTNGKSTTTALVGHIVKQAGKTAEVGGNIGIAALSLQPLSDGEIYVLELSSYQLDLLATTRFDVALLLNVSPDHIDRHGSLQGYMAAKMHIFDHQTQHDHAVIAVDDEHTRAAAAQLSSTPVQLTRVSIGSDAATIRVRDGILSDDANGFTCSLLDIRTLQGKHNWQNAAAAYAVARALDIPPALIESGLRSFPGLAHRMEWVAKHQGITFINDSKATNANATSHALGSWKNIYWIAGGVAKEGGITTLGSYFPRIARAYLIGQAQDSFAQTLAGEVVYTKCDTLDQAVEKAYADAQQEGLDNVVVMLSPACASFDQYANFEARGEHFKQLVHQLTHG